MNILNVVITKKCGMRLANSLFTGYGYQALEEKVMELKETIPFEDATVEGFIYQPAAGWQKLISITY